MQKAHTIYYKLLYHKNIKKSTFHMKTQDLLIIKRVFHYKKQQALEF